MKAATLLLILLSNQGYGLGGSDATVTVNWAADAKMPPAVFAWDLRFGAISLISGQMPLPDAKTPAAVKISLPAVRARTALTLHYRLQPAGGGADLETGDLPIRVYPADVLGDYSQRYQGKKVMVIENGGSLAKCLQGAKIQFTALGDASNLALQQPDVLFIGEDVLDDTSLAPGELESLADAGCQILVLRQSKVKTLLGYAIAARNTSASFAWRMDHPLLDSLEAGLPGSWLSQQRQELALQLPPDEPALEIAYWPPQVASKLPSPIDALLVTRSIGKGRVVLCQVPLGDQDGDPRRLLLMDNILNYFSTRPDPTPAPRDRLEPPKAKEPATRPGQIILPGDTP